MRDQLLDVPNRILNVKRSGLILAMGTLLLTGQGVLAAPICARGTLQTYIDLTDGCMVEDKTVSTFIYTPGQNSPQTTAIRIIPIVVANFPGLSFASDDFEAAAGQQQSFVIDFRIQVNQGGDLIHDVDLVLNDPAPGSLFGSIDISALLCAATTACVPPLEVFARRIPVPGDPLRDRRDVKLGDRKEFAPTDDISVKLNFSLAGGTNDETVFLSTNVRFSEVPEPYTSLLLVMGLLILLAYRPRRVPGVNRANASNSPTLQRYREPFGRNRAQSISAPIG